MAKVSCIQMKTDEQALSLAELLKDVHWRHHITLSQNDLNEIVVRAYDEADTLVEVSYVQENGSVNATR